MAHLKKTNGEETELRKVEEAIRRQYPLFPHTYEEREEAKDWGAVTDETLDDEVRFVAAVRCLSAYFIRSLYSYGLEYEKHPSFKVYCKAFLYNAQQEHPLLDGKVLEDLIAHFGVKQSKHMAVGTSYWEID